MSNLVHIANSLVCSLPEVELHRNRNSFDARETLDHLWTMLDDFGQRYCMYGCATCGGRMHEDEERDIGVGDNLTTCFVKAHNALGQLPDNIYQHLLSLTDGDCPICATLNALKQFPMIARHADTRPLDWFSLPCHFEQATSDSGYNYQERIRHIQALVYLDVASLPSRLTPADRHDIKARLAQGKAVAEFIRYFLDGRIQLSSALTDDDLWTFLKWRPSRDSLEFSGTPSRQWKAWAKKEVSCAKERGSPLFLTRLLRVAVNCYRNASHGYIEGYGGNGALERSALFTLFKEGEYLSGVFTETEVMKNGVYMPFEIACEEACKGMVALERFGRDYYYKLTFIGDRECQKHGGTPPPFFQHEIDEPVSSPLPTPPPVAVIGDIDNDVTANSKAQAAALGGDGGRGGDSDSVASVAFEKDAVKSESRIESGAVKMEANPTIHVAAPDMKPIADLFAPLMARLAEPEKRTADRPEKDSPIDSGDAPLPPLDSRVSRADLAAKLGKSTDTLQGWEKRGRAPGGVFWPKAVVTANNAYYNFREVWQSFVSLLPDKDRIQQVELIEGLSITKRP